MKALLNNIIIETPSNVSQDVNGISMDAWPLKRAKVVSAGPEVLTATTGDHILYRETDARRFVFENVVYGIITEDKLLAVI